MARAHHQALFDNLHSQTITVRATLRAAQSDRRPRLLNPTRCELALFWRPPPLAPLVPAAAGTRGGRAARAASSAALVAACLQPVSLIWAAPQPPRPQAAKRNDRAHKRANLARSRKSLGVPGCGRCGRARASGRVQRHALRWEEIKFSWASPHTRNSHEPTFEAGRGRRLCSGCAPGAGRGEVRLLNGNECAR